MAFMDNRNDTSNGAAMAALLAAAVGSFAVGFFVILHESGMYSAPSLFPPAGGLSGRAFFATAVWLLAWGVLHRSWKGRDVDAPRVARISVVLVTLAVMALFPPFWAILG